MVGDKILLQTLVALGHAFLNASPIGRTPDDNDNPRVVTKSTSRLMVRNVPGFNVTCSSSSSLPHPHFSSTSDFSIQLDS